MADRTFAICTGYMYCFEFILRITKIFAKGHCICEVSFNSRRSNSAKHRQACEKIIKCLLVIHPGKIKRIRDGTHLPDWVMQAGMTRKKRIGKG